MTSVRDGPVIWALAAVATALLLVWTFWPASIQGRGPELLVERSEN
jgi:hypothetical protein